MTDIGQRLTDILRRTGDEPRTVPEAQRWLHHRGFRECTEDNARHLLFVRRLVREGKVSDGNR